MFLPLVKAEDGSCDGWIPFGGGKGIKIEIIEEKQDMTKQSNDEVQYVTANVNVTNTNNFTCSYIETAVLVDGVCSDWKENFEKLNMIPEKTRKHYCYISLYDRGVQYGGLLPSESRVFNISYYGDWINVEYDGIKQDTGRQSTLDKQYLIKEAMIDSSKMISWKDILINVSMSDKCDDCVQNGSVIKPVLWFNFDDIENDTVYDKSGFGNNGSLPDSNGPRRTDGKLGIGLEFDGKDDYLSISSHGSDPEFNTSLGAISMWVKSRGNLGYVALLHFRKYSTSDYIIVRDAFNHVSVYGEVGDTERISVNSPAGSTSRNKWYHLVVQQTGSGIEIYIDGVNQSLSGTNSEMWFADVFPAISDFTIGHPGSWNNYFNGTIDEVYIYNRALTPDAIKEIGTGKTEIKDLYFHFSTTGISYVVSEPEKMNATGDFQYWVQKINVNSTLDTNIHNVTSSFPTNLKIKNFTFESENLTKIMFNESKIIFTIPKIEANSTNTYEITFATSKMEDNKTTNVSSSATGYSILYSPKFGYVVLTCSIVLAGLISYFVHKNRRKSYQPDQLPIAA
jgi:hypothetical protein